MKKLFLTGLFALALAVSSANALSLKKPDLGSDKVKLNKCLMDEGKAQLLSGNLTQANIKEVAKEISKICATKLALQDTDPATIELATTILQGLVK